MTEDFQKEINFLSAQLTEFKGAFLAGGAITSTFTNKPIRDFDLYFKTKGDFLKAVSLAYDESFWCVAITPRAITFIENNDTVYQFMCFDWFETAQKIFDKFDFTCCMAAIDLDTKEFIRHPNFLTDTSKRVLKFNHHTEFPIGSAMRVQKYESRGYTIDDSEFLKVMLACSFRAPKNWQDLKDQIGGQYGEAVSMDTSQEFTLDNAIKSLSDTLILKPAIVESDIAVNYEDALTKLFQDETKAAA